MQSFSIQDPLILSDPAAFYDQSRREAPVVFSEAHESFIFTRHADVKQLISNYELYDPRQGSLQNHQVNSGPFDFDPIFLQSPPHHTRLRKLAAGGYSMTAVSRFLREADEIALRLAGNLPDDGRPFDLIADFTEPLAIEAILRFLDVPCDHMPAVAETLRKQIRHEGDFATMEQHSVDLARHFIRHLNHAQDTGLGGFSGALIEARSGEDALTNAEIFGMLLLTAIGGAEDMARGLGNIFYCLNAYPDARRALLAEPEKLTGAAVLEALRLFPTTQYLRRVARRTVEVQGVTISEGAAIVGLLGPANWDETMFEDAGTMDLTRRNVSASLTFGSGPHVCIGKHVGKAIMEAGLRSMMGRIDRLSIDTSASVRAFGGPIFGFTSLAARMDADRGVGPTPSEPSQHAMA